MKANILKEYNSSKLTLEIFKDKMKSLISELAQDQTINVHQITGRLKERLSLERKIEKKRDKYSSLKDITDIVGIRVITYLDSDVDKIANIIGKEFNIDKLNSIDKRKLKSDQFGYRSLHFVVSCTKDRTKLAEYKRFESLKFEIQIRSVLQHAWAEIEHDLGYKGITSIPDAYKRSFNRLAALLETSDIEFDRLKKELNSYELEVADLIKTQPETVAIDQSSLVSFVRSNKIIQKALKMTKTNSGCEIIPDEDYKDEINRFLNFFKIMTIADLSNALSTNERLFLAFTNEFTKDFNYSELVESVAIFYFQHFLSAMSEDEKHVEEYVHFGEVNIEYTPGEYIDIFKKVKTAANQK